MPASLIDADSLLAVDVGTATTRALLFDVVEGHYRFIAAGQAPSTAAAPFRNVSEGVHQAIDNLQAITGRALLTAEHRLIIPTQEGIGVDICAATLSAGPAIKTVVVGLLSDVSLQSVQRLARTTYTRVVETIGMNDARKADEQIDNILHLHPDLILMAGGTEGGASRSVRKLLEIIGLACYLLPTDKRPTVLFAGNTKLVPVVKSTLENLTRSLHISPNLRPELEVEDLQPAQRVLAELYTEIRRGQIGGLDELNTWARGTLVSTAYAQARMIHFLSQVDNKSYLGVDVGAAAVNVVAGFGDEVTMGVYPQLGLGEGLAYLLRFTPLEDIQRWIMLDIPTDAIQDYLYQKSIYPTSVPATPEELAIEQALARQNLYLALNAASKDFPPDVKWLEPGLLPHFDPIIAGGSVLTRAPTLGQALLILLDAIQPVGVSILILDQNNLMSALGATSPRNSIIPVQVLDSAGAFLALATVVAPVVTARSGTPVMDVQLVYQNGNETRLTVKQGSLEVLPLANGQKAHLYLRPTHHANVGFGPGRGGDVPVSGSALGVVIDARGRPLHFPADHARRREFIKKWLWTLGG